MTCRHCWAAQSRLVLHVLNMALGEVSAMVSRHLLKAGGGRAAAGFAKGAKDFLEGLSGSSLTGSRGQGNVCDSKSFS